MAVRNRVCGPTQCGITAMTPRCTKSGGKLDGGQRMPGAGLSCRRSRKAPLGKPTFQPYWGKPAVRNDRGDRGNVGIIRSPIRASILPDYIGSIASFCLSAHDFRSSPGNGHRHCRSACLKRAINGNGQAHSITSSARASSAGGMVRPRAFADLRLTVSWTLVDCCTGKLASFSPLRTLPA
jgi:hypothetical protein